MLAFLFFPLAVLLGMNGQSVPTGALPVTTTPTSSSYLYLGLGCYNSPSDVCSPGSNLQAFNGYARAEYITSGSHAPGYAVTSCRVHFASVDAAPGDKYRCAVYDASNFNLIANCGQTTDNTASVGWSESAMPAGCTLAASSSYYIFVEASGFGTSDYVSTIYADGYSYTALSYGTWPSSLSAWGGVGAGYAFALKVAPL